MFGFEKKMKKEQIDYLTKIKPVLIPESNNETAEENKKIIETDQFIDKLNELTKRIEVLESGDDQTINEGPRKSRIKNQIVSLLEQHKKLSSFQLSDLVNLSRTRCNEYFRELSKEGLVEGIIIGKQKYYKLVRR